MRTKRSAATTPSTVTAAPGTTTIKVKVEQGGRIVVPAAFRHSLGVKPGDTVLVTLEEPDTIRIRSYPGAVRRIQELVRQYVPEGVSLVDELIQERRAEAARE
ncbi:MAG: AbrB/MazE/SpoVT family DNA-binding domain-containing protein [Chloroflexi bacterium]|nr:AbrB/MazE/SpoVT family DNA-binding domain-containing protein [Chloroflexota bacterium]